MTVLFINNAGAGFTHYVEAKEGITIDAFLAVQLGEDYKAENYLIRVNLSQPAARDQVLHDGDRVSATPTKIEGAL